ncbi:hypothetical protein BLNAU_18863 [Blattamonas nauphoetae]|uniref:Tail specific protease domain-containing protein n=1 Tax=Blattamonas nauphoetae TaxID=2049346 RepID=A0ABQ9X350_9EUKA|nr:hypothetical protein BLNAU_18863 [Blattamonas nauphoetae]
MLFCSASLLFLLVHFDCSAECNLSPFGLYTLAEVEECVNTITWDKTNSEFTTAISVLKEYMENMAFKDILKSPPEPYEKLKQDITANLDKILGEATSTFDFYTKILATTNSMKDAHTSYAPPCLSLFYYILPFVLLPERTPELTTPSLKVYAHVQSASSYTKAYLKEHTNPHENLTGCEITAIAIDGTNYVEGETPIETIAKWADEFISLSKDRSGRMNYVAAQGFGYARMTLISPPAPTIKVKYIYVNPETEVGTEYEATLEWKASFQGNSTITNINALCPISYASNDDISTVVKTPLELEKEASDSIHERFFPQTPVEGIKMITPPESNGPSYKVIIIDSFSMYPDQFAAAAYKLLQQVKTSGAEYLILDVRGNTGGFGRNTFQLLHFLFPSVFPSMGRSHLRSTPFNTDYLTLMMSGDEYPRSTDSPYKKLKSISTKLWDFKEMNGSSYTQKYTQQYYLNTAPTEYKELVKSWKAYPGFSGKPLYDREHLIVLTDGMCGSACGMFVNPIIEHNLGRVIGVGGMPGMTREEYAAASFDGASVLNSGTIRSILPKSTNIPASFPRSGQSITWAAFGQFSSLLNQTDKMMEFIRFNPHRVLPYFVPFTIDRQVTEANPHLLTLAENAIKTFDKCEEGDIIDQPSKCASATGSHLIRGFKCDPATHSWDETKCFVTNAEPGYFINAKGEAEKTPNISGLVFKVTVEFGWILGVIIMVFIAVILIIAIVMICRKTRKGQMDRVPRYSEGASF